MPSYIQHIETIVPQQVYPQDTTRDLIKKNVSGGDRMTQSIIHRVYGQSGIEKRHSVIRDFDLNGESPLFFDEDGSSISIPGTKRRNDIYTQQAKILFADVARRCVSQSGVDKNDITHVITVSCTGFFAPGPEFHIVKELGLSPTVQRFHLGFMGCFAAFPALKMADAFCKANPDACVLVVALELCTVHLQFNKEVDTILSGSVFADGGAAVLVSAQKPENKKTALEITGFATGITPKGEQDMAWTIGDTGFDMVLTTYVPDIIEENIQPMIQSVLQDYSLSENDIAHWAIHPGGRAIIDRIQKALALHDQDVVPSRDILKNYGNMSSATVLFVLHYIMNNNTLNPNERVLGMAFGPGLTVETGLFQIV